MADPWFKFYPTDWRADPALRMCSLAARGLWIEMLGLMHDAAQYGHLLVANKPPTDAQLAVLIGAPPEQISELVGELEAAAVFSRTRKGVIFSRKMVRDQKKAEQARKNGKKGGNPSLRKDTDNLPPDNQKVKGHDRPQKPEARSQTYGGGDDARASNGNQTLLERVCIAAGRPIGSITPSGKTFLPGEADGDTVRRWVTDLGLSEDQIVAEVERQTRGKRDGPPNSLTYFTQGLQRLAGGLKAPPLTPIEGGRNVQPAVDRHEAAAADAFRRRHLAAATARRAPTPDFSDG